LTFIALCSTARSQEATDIRVAHRHGQTFITWKDAAQGEDAAKYRYALYRSERPITQDNLAQAKLCYQGILFHSARLYGTAFTFKDRLDPEKPMAVIEEGGKPLPAGSGLAVHTVARVGKAYYAVVTTDVKLQVVSKVLPGKNATTEAIEEKAAPIQPIKLWDSKERKGPYVANTSITGKKDLPLHVTLHGSQSNGGGAGEYGDYYLFFGTPEMGERDGLPGVFSVTESRSKEGNQLTLRPRDAVEHPSGRAMETYWLGYTCVPQGGDHTDARFYPYTENRLVWMTNWAVKHYSADAQRVSMGGSSSGGVGSMNVGFRHAELFAAVYPSVARVRKVPAIPLDGKLDKNKVVYLAGGTTNYLDRVDGPKFAAEHSEHLPFLGWACGRNDGYATWQEHIDMVAAMTKAHHGFAFAWNNGGHGEGGRAMQSISKYYSAEKFARDRSYPAFGNSSLDDKMGGGDPKDGDLEGGINLGFVWKDVTDEKGKWSIRICNELAKKDITVDVTPRRCQSFKPEPGDKFKWTASTGDSGEAIADKNGLVTIEKLKIAVGKETTLTIAR